MNTLQTETEQYSCHGFGDVMSKPCDTFNFDPNIPYQITQRFTEQFAATFAYRCHLCGCPIIRICSQLQRQKTVRQEDQIYMTCLPLRALNRQSSQSKSLSVCETKQRLFTVPMKGFRACPTTAVRFHDSFQIPMDFIRRENLAGFLVVLVFPQTNDSDFVIDIGHLDANRQGPLYFAVDHHLFTITRRNRLRKICGRLFLALKNNFTIELQIADITAFASVRVFKGVDMILYRGTRIKTIEGKTAGYVRFLTPVDKFVDKFCHLLELVARLLNNRPLNNCRSFDNRHVRIPFRNSKYFPMSVIGSLSPNL